MTSFIYVIAAREDGPVKIGLSVHPEKRLKQLQTGHAEALQIWHTQAFEADRTKLMESLIHDALRLQRAHGEWFNISVKTAILEVDFALIRYGDHANLRSCLRR